MDSGWVPPDTKVDEFEFAIRTVLEPFFEKPLSEISFGHVLLNRSIQPVASHGSTAHWCSAKDLLYVGGWASTLSAAGPVADRPALSGNGWHEQVRAESGVECLKEKRRSGRRSCRSCPAGLRDTAPDPHQQRHFDRCLPIFAVIAGAGAGTLPLRVGASLLLVGVFC